jgi:DNA gyrase inhibitor GyrI
MNDLNVHIEELEPMLMASAYGFGDSPEIIAHQKMYTFAKSQGLIDGDKVVFRHFGFNNPSPLPGSPNYGYEVWITVDPQIKPEGDIRLIYFPGGLYAVTQFVGVSNIGETWRKLVTWRENSHYRKANHQWLEELLNPLESDFEKYIFKLYLPIVD